ncbi:MAG: hypothetical protein VXX86_08100 [Planctomycetota bacterium]|nr:hypothetical protein [Planctomycetota bacterium]
MTSTTAELILTGAFVAPAPRLVDDRPVEVVDPLHGVERRRVLEERLHNDEVLLTRQAREIAALEGLLGRLEQRLDRAENDLGDLRSAPPLQGPEAPAAPAVRVEPTAVDTPYEVVVREQVVVQPTVYTNLGSLLDVFA